MKIKNSSFVKKNIFSVKTERLWIAEDALYISLDKENKIFFKRENNYLIHYQPHNEDWFRSMKVVVRNYNKKGKNSG